MLQYPFTQVRFDPAQQLAVVVQFSYSLEQVVVVVDPQTWVSSELGRQ